MFQEALAKLTADHLRTHIQTYLEDIQGLYTGTDIITLSVPEVSDKTLVGGVMSADIDRLPLIGVDCVEKQEIPSGESLYYYQYDGAIVGLVRGVDESLVDRTVKRYNRAIETFVKEHQYLHDIDTDNPLNPEFSIREFLYTNTSFSGSIEVTLDDDNKLWVAGFTCNVAWFTSEDYYKQHS